MRKTVRYIVLLSGLGLFVYAFVITGSFLTALALAALALAWFLFENMFALFSDAHKPPKNLAQDHAPNLRKDRDALNKAAKNNPTIR